MQANENKSLTIEVDGVTYERYPIKTHVVTDADDIRDVAEKYAKEHMQEGDLLFISEKMRRLHTKARNTDGGYKAATAGKAFMQICLQIALRNRTFNSADDGNGSARVRNGENTVCGVLFGSRKAVRQTGNFL